MNQVNPFTLSFGKKPKSLIEREIENSEIIDNFTSENPGYHVCMITGVRGGGKTVALTTISDSIKNKNNWIVVNLNPDRDLLYTLASELCSRKDLVTLFREAKINLSFLGFGIEIDNEPPVLDITIALNKMLKKLTLNNKKILITIDEVTPSKTFKEFASQFQIFMRENFNIFLLMAGLFENIDALQNENTLTFLYRAPKIKLRPLSNVLMAETYKNSFNLSNEDANKMANFTKGYPFVFQLLGYLRFLKQKELEDIIPEFDSYIEEYSYEKIWSECSDLDRNVLSAIESDKPTKVETIRDKLNMSSNLFSVYRKRLLRKGLIDTPSYGYLEFTLPRFGEFIRRNM